MDATSDRKFSILFEAIQDAIVVADLQSKILQANRAAMAMLGCGKADLMYSNAFEFVADQSRPAVREMVRRVIDEGLTQQMELVGRRKDGTEFTAEVCCAPVNDKTGKTVSLVAVGRDITRRKRADEALRLSEEKYRTLFEQSRDLIYVTTPEGRIIDINPAGLELLGYASKEELFQVRASDLYVNPEHRARLSSLISQKGYAPDVEIALRRKDGKKITVSAGVNPLRDGAGKITAYWGMARDMTGHKDLEQQLTQAQKMESIGRLVGGVAHDFNNILTGIIGFADLALIGLAPDHPLWFHLDQIKKQGDRAAALTRQLLAFSSRQLLERRNLDLNQIVRDMDKFLGRVIGEHVEIKVICAPDLRTVFADAAQVQHVLMNLCLNARDAMPDGGDLIIETRNIILRQPYKDSQATIEPGEFVQVSVTDTGAGMSDDVKRHLFEPFFTTKAGGDGVGLGLAAVYGIVRQHKGVVHVYSEPGKGTTVKVYFRALTGPDEKHEPQAPVQSRAEGNETILVAEDEPAVRELIARVLKQSGYRVVVAENGQEALRVFDENSDNVRLAVLDVVMPRMNGDEVYQHIKMQKPGVKSLFISGYASGGIHNDFDLRPGIEFLQKPFNPSDLARRVREILDTPSP